MISVLTFVVAFSDRQPETDQRGATQAIAPLCVVGSFARGALFALVGALIIEAAVRFKPDDAAGIDAAIRTLAEQPFGRALLALTAARLFAFGIYGLIEARRRAT